MLRASVPAGLAATIVVTLLALAVPHTAVAGGGSSSANDPATAIYVEQVPAAAGTSSGDAVGGGSADDPATSIYVERPAAASGSAEPGEATAQSIEELLASPTLGAPSRVRAGSGADVSSQGSFSLDTLLAVAGIGTGRFVALLVVLVLITVTLGATALTTLSRR